MGNHTKYSSEVTRFSPALAVIFPKWGIWRHFPSDAIHSFSSGCSALTFIEGGVHMHRTLAVLLVVFLAVALAVPSATAQLTVQKWTFFTGYTHLQTPTTGLGQDGYNLSFGRNVNRWLGLGFDFSHLAGSGVQTQAVSNLVSPAQAQLLASALGLPALPALPALQVPYNASTLTFAVGPKFNLRKIERVTPFFNPFLGAFRNNSEGKLGEVPAPSAALAPLWPTILGAAQKVVPASSLTQNALVMGYGVGGGVDLNITTPIGIRFTTEYIRTALYGGRQNNIRLSCGLLYRFGGAIGK
jgi:opacity protein-like surface antigen